MMVAVLVINEHGEALAERLLKGLDGITVIKRDENESLASMVARIFHKYEGLIFIAALGIVVRVISPFIKSKHTDPAIVCVDTGGRFAISVLSGHEGRANELAFRVAAVLDAIPVITTGTETRKRLILGIGCRKGITRDTVRDAILNTLDRQGLEIEGIRLAVTASLKKGEIGLIEACEELNLPLIFIPNEQIRCFHGEISHSDVVERHVGLKGVCEPCALLAGRNAGLIVKKQKLNGVTIAIAMEG
ncbi:MAG: cobalamin biosynthesis protein [bacterium]